MHVTPDIYLEARITVPNELVDVLSDFVIQHISSGMVLEEEEGATETTVIFYVPSDNTVFEKQIKQYLTEKLNGGQLPELRISRVENTEWLAKYRDSIGLVRIGHDLVVRPPWFEPTDDSYQIVIEPKMAFGTGSHATTRSCLRLVREYFQPGMRFLEMGCGSGIQSIMAHLLGAGYIKAVDYDLAAVANCRENFDVNQVTTPHDILTGSIDKCISDEPYDMVCANIIRSTILAMFELLLKVTKTDGRLLLSGLLDRDEAAITSALRRFGQDRFEIIPDEEWLTYNIHKR